MSLYFGSLYSEAKFYFRACGSALFDNRIRLEFTLCRTLGLIIATHGHNPIGTTCFPDRRRVQSEGEKYFAGPVEPASIAPRS